MNDIKLGISKSRGYENVDLEALCNEKTPQGGEKIKSVSAWNGEVSVRVSGMKEFNELLGRAEKEAQQLKNTIDELRDFRLKLSFYEETEK